MRATNQLFFFVELVVVVASFSASLCLLLRILWTLGLDLDLRATPRETCFLALLAVFSTLDAELLPLFPWRAPERLTAKNEKSLKHFALKNLGSNFPSVFAARLSLSLDVLKHGTTIAQTIATITEPSTRSVIEFATLIISLTSVALTFHRRIVLLRRKEPPRTPRLSPAAVGKAWLESHFSRTPRATTTRSDADRPSSVTFTANPVFGSHSTVELPECREAPPRP